MSTINTSVEPEYELKHRLTGAAILIVLAVVVIPLFLSEPALEANSAVDKDGVAVQTFRSRIVPLNINNVNGGNGAGESSGESSDINTVEVDSRKPALLDLTLSGGKSAEATDGSAQKAETQKTALVMTEKKAENTDNKSALKSLTKAETKITQPKGAASKTVEKLAAGSKNTTSKNVPKENASGDSGWVVRVGTFSKKANVDSVSTLLNNSGFNPKTKSVDTSLGKSTRVWLGPYAKRETADKISARLKSLIGEKGYVTRTNS